jgi:hypothetical protein
MPFYIRDLGIHGFWYLKGDLETNLWWTVKAEFTKRHWMTKLTHFTGLETYREKVISARICSINQACLWLLRDMHTMVKVTTSFDVFPTLL